MISRIRKCQPLSGHVEDCIYKYLYGTQFTVQTDCQALTILNGKLSNNARVARWQLEMQSYEFRIEIIKGSTVLIIAALILKSHGYLGKRYVHVRMICNAFVHFEALYSDAKNCMIV